MNRRSFLKIASGFIAALAIKPKAILAQIEAEPIHPIPTGTGFFMSQTPDPYAEVMWHSYKDLYTFEELHHSIPQSGWRKQNLGDWMKDENK